jgi:transcriptional regulator with XRE-family HTH domain
VKAKPLGGLDRRFRDLLRGLRTDAGLTQTELARRLGRPQSYVSKYEAGERRLDFLEVREVCSALGTPMEEFLRRFEERS